MDENENEIARIGPPRPPLSRGACTVVAAPTSEESNSENVLPFPTTAEPQNILVPLYPDQRVSVDDLQDRMLSKLESDERARVVLVAPTGFGKTECLTEVIAWWDSQERGCVLFLVDKISLLTQTAERFRKWGLRCGVVGNGIREQRADDQVVVMTVQSAIRVLNMWNQNRYTLIIIDEAHTIFKKHASLLIRDVPAIATTATPHNLMLPGLFDEMVLASSLATMVESKRLARPRVFQPKSQINLKKIDHGVGDYNMRHAGMRARSISGDVVGNWLDRGEQRKTLVFACSCDHADSLRGEFRAAGVKAETIHSKMPDKEGIKKTVKRFRAGKFPVLISVDMVIEGFDVPDVSCVVIARPTASEKLHVQMVGRGLRYHEGKVDCLVFDHASNFSRFGPLLDYQPPSLEEMEYRCGKTTKSRSEERGESVQHFCKKCDHEIHGMFAECSNCGHQEIREPSQDVVVDTADELIEHAGDKVYGSLEEQLKGTLTAREFYQQMLWLCKDGKPQPAYFSTLKVFGVKAPFNWQQLQPIKASPEVKRWRQYDLIRWKKMRRA